MKKILCLAIIAIASISASAQNWYLGGGISYDHTETEGIESDVFTISPELGYTINEKWAIGATLGYTWEKDVYNSFAINPYARYTYFKTENNLVNLFVDGGFGVGIISPEKGDSSTIWEIGFKPGIALNVTEQFSLVAHVGFLGYQDYDVLGENYGLNLSGSNISFGFYYNF